MRDACEALLRLLAAPAALGELVRAEVRSASPIVTIPYERAYADGFEDMPRPCIPLRQIIADVVAFERRYRGTVAEE